MPVLAGHPNPPPANRPSFPVGGPLVYPVAAADALAWADGAVDDLHLVLRAPLVPQAVFVCDLPNLAAWRPLLRQCAHWQRAGAIGMVSRTHNQVIIDHLTPFGWVATFQENETQCRYLMPTEGFRRWLARF